MFAGSGAFQLIYLARVSAWSSARFKNDSKAGPSAPCCIAVVIALNTVINSCRVSHSKTAAVLKIHSEPLWVAGAVCAPAKLERSRKENERINVFMFE